MPQSFPWALNANNATGNSSSSVSHRLTAIVDFGMDDDGASDNGIFRTGNCNVVHRQLVVRLTFAI
jgi:hypothetical protein